MALLYYENIGVPSPEAVLRKTYFGLRTFFKFLERSLAHVESADCVLRLAWKPGGPPDGAGPPPEGVWVELEAPEDRPGEPDATFRAFLDENNRDLYEAPPSERGPEAGSRPVRLFFHEAERIVILDRDPDTNQLLLERPPALPHLLVRPNTHQLKCQLRAVQSLQDAPAPEHLPLLRLFAPRDDALWGELAPDPEPPAPWMALKHDDRPGTGAQRDFVRIALATPDFAFLEGPPGSGKTTAICELILQLARKGERVLLCASTHVAVDNVLERLAEDGSGRAAGVIPVRVGEARNISEAAKPYQLDQYVRTERQRLVDFLEARRPRSDAQETLLDALRGGPTAIERMVLEAANLVCGTTIGILQHPEFKAARNDRRPTFPQFDVLVLDEASKTPFQEFLVPALLAKRWIIVGDPHQLSPYVDDELVAANLQSCLVDVGRRNACVDVFQATREDPRARRATLVVPTCEAELAAYAAQGAAKGASVRGCGDADLALADIVVAAPGELAAVADRLPLDLATVRGAAVPDLVARRAEAWRRRSTRHEAEAPAWEDEMAWRLARHYEQRFAEGETSEKLWKEIEALRPAAEVVPDAEATWSDIDRVRRVAFPSVLESLQFGFEKDANQSTATAMSDGLPDQVFEARHVLLEFQHRMHPEISAFPRTHVYANQALQDPDDMAERRAWSYGAYQHRGVWLDVRGEYDRRWNRNLDEVDVVLKELRRFLLWARENRRTDGRPWEAAILAFHRGQEREVRERLRRVSGEHQAYRRFRFGRDRAADLVVDLCTVDRFQGHEADVVFLSLACTWPTNFLESPNRLNVALTRARYQRVVVGNRSGMQRSRGPVLRALAESKAWESMYGGGQ